jgi:hypothetical protein
MYIWFGKFSVSFIWQTPLAYVIFIVSVKNNEKNNLDEPATRLSGPEKLGRAIRQQDSPLISSFL